KARKGFGRHAAAHQPSTVYDTSSPKAPCGNSEPVLLRNIRVLPSEALTACCRHCRNDPEPLRQKVLICAHVDLVRHSRTTQAVEDPFTLLSINLAYGVQRHRGPLLGKLLNRHVRLVCAVRRQVPPGSFEI